MNVAANYMQYMIRAYISSQASIFLIATTASPITKTFDFNLDIRCFLPTTSPSTLFPFIPHATQTAMKWNILPQTIQAPAYSLVYLHNVQPISVFSYLFIGSSLKARRRQILVSGLGLEDRHQSTEFHIPIRRYRQIPWEISSFFQRRKLKDYCSRTRKVHLRKHSQHNWKK